MLMERQRSATAIIDEASEAVVIMMATRMMDMRMVEDIRMAEAIQMGPADVRTKQASLRVRESRNGSHESLLNVVCFTRETTDMRVLRCARRCFGRIKL